MQARRSPRRQLALQPRLRPVSQPQSGTLCAFCLRIGRVSVLRHRMKSRGGRANPKTPKPRALTLNYSVYYIVSCENK